MQAKYNIQSYSTKGPKRIIDPYIKDSVVKSKLKQVTY